MHTPLIDRLREKTAELDLPRDEPRFRPHQRLHHRPKGIFRQTMDVAAALDKKIKPLVGAALGVENHKDPGIAHGMHGREFNQADLRAGTLTEELEHGLPRHRATEIAMGHLVENPREYAHPEKVLDRLAHARGGTFRKTAAPYDYIGGNRLLRHLAAGAGAGGLVGLGVHDDSGDEANDGGLLTSGRLKSGLKGAAYGAAAGLGVSHKTNPILRRRYEELQKLTTPGASIMERFGTSKLGRKIPGMLEQATKAKAKREAHIKDFLTQKLERMTSQDRQERLTEGAIGAALGLGAGAGTHAVYNSLTGRGAGGTTGYGPGSSYQFMLPRTRPYQVGEVDDGSYG